MKCDELQYERLGDANKTYPASTLVIRKQFVDAAIEELKAKLESVQATTYTESVDAGMENRRLKRALWIARAMRADDAAHWTVYVTYMHYHENSFYAFDGDDIFHRHNKNLDGFKLWCSKWETVKGKCLKKAEEYK